MHICLISFVEKTVNLQNNIRLPHTYGNTPKAGTYIAKHGFSLIFNPFDPKIIGSTDIPQEGIFLIENTKLNWSFKPVPMLTKYNFL